MYPNLKKKPCSGFWYRYPILKGKMAPKSLDPFVWTNSPDSKDEIISASRNGVMPKPSSRWCLFLPNNEVNSKGNAGFQTVEPSIFSAHKENPEVAVNLKASFW